MPATVTSKGQVTIPKRIRVALGLTAGAKVEFLLESGRAIVEPVGSGSVESAAGALKKYAKRKGGESERDMTERVRREVAHEAAREGRPSRYKRTS